MSAASKQSPTTVKHPAWEVFWEARRAWEATIDEGAKHHRRMMDAQDELVRAGEMLSDDR